MFAKIYPISTLKMSSVVIALCVAQPLAAQTTPLEGIWHCNIGETHQTVEVRGLSIKSGFKHVRRNGKLKKDYGVAETTLTQDARGHYIANYQGSGKSWRTERYRVSNSGAITTETINSNNRRDCQKVAN